MKRFTRKLFVALALLFAALPLSAQSFMENIDWSVRGTVLFFPERNGNASAPMPILPSLGVAASYDQTELLSWEVSLDVYGNTYTYSYDLNRVLPANDEHRDSFAVGFLLGFQPVFRFNPMGDKFTIRAYGGLAFDLRLVFRAYGLKKDEVYDGYSIGERTKDITSYFWGGGRFIFPFIGGGMDFDVMEGIRLGFDLRAWLPVWRLWTGENMPFIEGFRFGVGFRVSFL